MHKKLTILQEDDEYDDTLEVPAQAYSFRRGRRRRGSVRNTRITYREEGEEEEEKVVVRIGGRVERFVKERKEMLETIYAVSRSYPS